MHGEAQYKLEEKVKRREKNRHILRCIETIARSKQGRMMGKWRGGGARRWQGRGHVGRKWRNEETAMKGQIWGGGDARRWLRTIMENGKRVNGKVAGWGLAGTSTFLPVKGWGVRVCGPVRPK